MAARTMGRFAVAHVLACLSFAVVNFGVGFLWIDLMRTRLPQGFDVAVTFGLPFSFVAALVIGLPATGVVSCVGQTKALSAGAGALIGALYGTAIGLMLDVVWLGVFVREGGSVPAFAVSCGLATCVAGVSFVWFMRPTASS